MKKRISLIIAALLLVAAIFGGVYASAEEPATEAAPTMKIKGAALILGNSVDIQYIAELDGIEASDVKLLVWDSVPSEYAYGTQKYTVSYINGDTLKSGGVTYPYFRFTNAGAKMMTKDYYAVLYATTDEGAIYSSPVKYSILNYAYNKLGITGTETTNENLKSLLEVMLEYGAHAQKYLGYETNRLANDAFYQIKVSGGTLDDGFKTGLYLEGETVKLTAPLTNDGGEDFLCWVDSLGNLIGKSTTATAIVGSANTSYTALYGECESHIMGEWTIEKNETCTEEGLDSRECLICGEVETRAREMLLHDCIDGICQDCGGVIGSQGLDYVLNLERTHMFVWGIGTCTDIDVIISPTHEGYIVKEIYQGAFRGNTNISSITIPDTVTKISTDAFYESSVTEVHIGNGVTSIGDSAFAYCSSLTNVTIPDSVTEMGASMFYGCDALESATIGNAVPQIGLTMFRYCKNLASVTIGNGVTEIEACAFDGCESLANIEIHRNITSIASDAFNECLSLKSITVDEENSKFCDIDGNLYTKDGEIILRYASGKTETSFTVPTSVTKIGEYAFSSSKKLQVVTISENVTEIGNYAFYHSRSLMRVIIPESVTTIGVGAFNSCNTVLFKNVNFENPNGWQVTKDGVTTDISADDLYSSKTAAEYLLSTYSSYTWKRT